MGIYLNPDNADFQQALNSQIYVDKTGLIAYTNKLVQTEQKYICVSRPRRFGKSMAANMLTAYYSRGCDSAEMFAPYQIAQADTFQKHLNRYNVIRINMIRAFHEGKNVHTMIQYLQEDISHEISKQYPDFEMPRRPVLASLLEEAYYQYKIPFVFIIDEWDCIFREHKHDLNAQKEYLDFLRDLLKDKSYAALAYMTGILPIKKYGKHSALNMFTEISMTDASPIPEFTGFTDEEVQALCTQYQVDYDTLRHWYNGYQVNGISIYNPKSAVESILRRNFGNYWTSTETYEALREHFHTNFDGLHDMITDMIGGGRVKVNTSKFQNDMTSLNSADDVLTLLVHLGYLTYRATDVTGEGEVWIPNSEVQQEFINSVEDGGWEELVRAIRVSESLLEATLECDADKVAEMVAQAHDENTSILQYNNENSLACVITIAYYTARKKYILHRELATGKGFADIVFIPRKNTDNPAIVVELKRNQSADSAIAQIKAKQYTKAIEEYTGDILLVGISYDENSKQHSCTIERYQK